MTKGLFITGTGTDVGKTFATGVLVKTLREAGVNCGYYKAALSGAERQGKCLIPGDAAFVKEMANLTDAYEELVSYCYETAVSPHLAAQIEGNPVELSKVVQDYTTLSQRYSRILVEGSGENRMPYSVGRTAPLDADGCDSHLKSSGVVNFPKRFGVH